jgi:hypothetical protein
MRRSGLRPVVVEELRCRHRRLPFAAITDEIEKLRAVERAYQTGNEELDRLQRSLVSAHPGHLVVFPPLPMGTWARLPEGWQTDKEWKLTLLKPPIPGDLTGAAAVSVSLAQQMVSKCPASSI